MEDAGTSVAGRSRSWSPTGGDNIGVEARDMADPLAPWTVPRLNPPAPLRHSDWAEAALHAWPVETWSREAEKCLSRTCPNPQSVHCGRRTSFRICVRCFRAARPETQRSIEEQRVSASLNRLPRPIQPKTASRDRSVTSKPQQNFGRIQQEIHKAKLRLYRHTSTHHADCVKRARFLTVSRH